jgi:hypothetical protein
VSPVRHRRGSAGFRDHRATRRQTASICNHCARTGHPVPSAATAAPAPPFHPQPPPHRQKPPPLHLRPRPTRGASPAVPSATTAPSAGTSPRSVRDYSPAPARQSPSRGNETGEGGSRRARASTDATLLPEGWRLRRQPRWPSSTRATDKGKAGNPIVVRDVTIRAPDDPSD